MKYEVFSSGGGCYHSYYRDGGYVYVVDSEFPACITCYNGDDWSSENMIFSYGINEDGFKPYKELYERLLENLKPYIKK